MSKLISLFIPVMLFVTATIAQDIGHNDLRSAQGNFNQYLSKTVMKNVDANISKEGAITTFNNEENTKGTRFLFNTWVTGDSVVNTQDNYINTATFLLNFDKLTGNLLVTQDKINIMAVAPAGINSFILKNNGKQYLFEHVKAIDPLKFFLALVKSETSYSLYKQFVTKFVKANFRNDGVVQTGNDFNEYKDESEYYIVQQSTGAVTPINFKPKTIKAALPEKKEKTDIYFKQHRDEVIDENFLVGLIEYLNQ